MLIILISYLMTYYKIYNECTGQRTISSINKNNKINYTNYYYCICNCIHVCV